MADLGFSTHTPRAGNRALSTNHTEAGRAKEAPFIIYTDPRPFVFSVGDEVEIVDDNDPRKGQRGIVTARRVGFPNTYSVKMPYGIASIFSFKEHQIRKVGKKSAAAIHPYALPVTPRKSTAVRVDTFSCPLGVFDLTVDPKAPERYMAYKKSLDSGLAAFWRALPDMARVAGVVIDTPVIPLETMCVEIRAVNLRKNGIPDKQRAAHEKFLAFMASLDKPRYTRHELREYIAAGMAKRAMGAAA